MMETCCDSPDITADPDWLSQVVVRKITKSDLPALEWDGEYRHLRRVYSFSFQAQESGRAVIWVAEHPDAGIIGQIFLQLISDRLELADGINCAHIYSFRIKPPFRGSGLGSHMLEEAEIFLHECCFPLCDPQCCQNQSQGAAPLRTARLSHHQPRIRPLVFPG